MRVIAGKYKGRRCYAPHGDDVRPTSDRVKEAVFSMMAPYIEDAVCLDLFAGSGNLGIEALSRGAIRVYFCDNSAATAAFIKKNLVTLGIGDEGRVIIADWRDALSKIPEPLDIVFIDAPYAMCEYYGTMLETIASKGLIRENGLVIIEKNARVSAEYAPAGFGLLKEKRYGGIGIDLLRLAPE